VDGFWEAWKQLPQGDRDTITAEVAAYRGESMEIQLRDEHHGFTRGPSGDATAQLHHLLGESEIIFRSLLARHLPTPLCSYWIAHELAHAFLSITDPNHGKDYPLAEKQVAALLTARWGFGDTCEEDLRIAVSLINNRLDAR
jgi:hypothetical protein